MGDRTRTTVYLEDELRAWADENEDVESLSSVTNRLLHAARRGDIDISDIGTQDGTQREDTRLHERMDELESRADEAFSEYSDAIKQLRAENERMKERISHLEDMARS